MTREEAIIQLEYRKDFATPDQIEALDMAISALSENKRDTVSRVAYEQIMWERDTAVQQLKDLGYGLGEKPKENKGGWIPITAGMELPEHDVICCDNDGDIDIGYLYFDEEENQIACDRDPYVMFGVVAYMELPEPYKKGE